MRSRNVLVVSAITASLLSGLWLRPKQPQAAAEAILSQQAVTKPGVTEPGVKSPVLLPAQASQPKTKDGRQYPLVPAEPAELATLLAAVEQALRDPATAAEALPDLGHQQQVIYRVLSTDQPRSHRGPTMLPAWRIIQPEPAANLLSYYRKAEAATGIEWEVLAAVNLVETGMGRIDGISVANAQGPMQFLPTTWAEPGIGAGNIRDPHDAIQAAARYLVRRGGLQDIRRGLWGYNNSDYYGRAVLLYASLMKEDPAAYTGLYHWEIHFNAAAGDLWLPVGYNQPQRITVEQHLQANPASRSPNG